ncbi:CaiB/BaiF CoA-transferase family protein [Gordonia sp. SCSIO 19800]|uniref:CaiB/BaiF CoA transferase family protein n=1 Tax=Gordonia sp. SCSIO 19800 TaxID=2826926 RepID=UPI001B83F050|nr:CoA transferase [Gordonia sp. SCSIO 19800]MBR7194628.1 CoA transferase [Gordonia sp. SCSIO 19800]
MLDGIRVLDAASLAAGPLTGTFLAELGAEVIKIEQPGGGDAIRKWGAQKDGHGLMWKSVGRNKLTATLDLRRKDGQDLLRSLAGKADVIIVNTRYSTLEKWGLGYEALSAVNPGLIMLHVTGFGAGGPYSDRPGFGTLSEAMSGFAHTTGQADGPPTLPSFMLADGVAALTGTYAVLAALYHRDLHNGTGQLIDLSLIEPLSRLIEQSVLVYDQLGEIQTRFGNKWDISAPRNTYLTKDGKWIAVSGSAPSIAKRIFAAIGQPHLSDSPDFGDPQQRLRNADAVDAAVADWIGERTCDEAMAVFEREQVAAAPVYDASQLLDDPHLRARGTYAPVDDPDLGPIRMQAPVPRFSETPARVTHSGRALGADNDYVYRKLLDLDEQTISRLGRDGTI